MEFTITDGMTHDRKATRNTARDAEKNNAGFIGVDGEGMLAHCLNNECDCRLYGQRSENNPRCHTCGHAPDSHYHAYVLLGVGDRHIDIESLGVSEITWEPAFEFLYAEFARRENRYMT